MSKGLDELIQKASEAYPDDFVSDEFFQMKADKPESFRTELASFIVRQMRDLYDVDSSDEQNITRIVGGLEHARDDLEAVIGRLNRLLK